MAAARTAAEAAMTPVVVDDPLSKEALRIRTLRAWRALVRKNILDAADDTSFSTTLTFSTSKHLSNAVNIANLKVYVDILLDEARDLKVLWHGKRVLEFSDVKTVLIEPGKEFTYTFNVMWDIAD
jgi:hypothetical protein